MNIPDEIQEQLNSVLQFVGNNKYSTLYTYVPSVKKAELETIIKSIPTVTKESIRSYPGSLPHYPEKDVRYLASEFDPKDVDSLFLLPQKIDAIWRLLKDLLGKKDSIVAMLSIPLFWQIGPLFYHTCRESGVPTSVISPRNLPLARQVIKEVGAQLVVTTPDAARELHDLLSQEGIENQIHTWLLVVPFGSNFNLPTLSGNVFIEYHIFPGIPIGYTFPKLLKENPKGLIPSPEYFFEEHNNKCLITSLQPHALPFIRLEVGGNAEKTTHEGQNIIVIQEYVF